MAPTLPTAAASQQSGSIEQHQGRMQTLRRRRAESGASTEKATMRRGCLWSSTATAAVLLIAVCVQEARGYSPSLGIARQYLTPRQLKLSTSTLRRPSSVESSHRGKYVGARHTHLFSTPSDVSQEPADGAAIATDTSDQGNADRDGEAVFDNLLPSTMVSAANARVAKRPATGLSSSVLLPLSEPDASLQSTPLFQTSINPTADAPAKATSWKERLVDVSNLASLLCVLDCTLLPLVSVAIPALSWGVGLVTGAGSATAAAGASGPLASLLAYLPALSHGIALYFVIPVGLLTTVVNYFFGHREARFSLASLLGVALIYVANSSVGVGIPSVDAWLHSVGIASSHGGHAHHVHDACGAVVGAATGMMAHTCPEGLAHRMTNTLGCALLLGSNYYSKKYMEKTRQGCAASHLAEAWGGDSGGRSVCPPGCGCEKPSYGTGAGARFGGETFFEWDRSAGRGDMNRGRAFGSRFRR
ncbi:hypothetical protein ACHAXT_000371 [Thalassiosira profunda]